MPLLLPQPKFREFTALGDAPLVGGTVETYEAGTSTPVVTFADATGASANPWPVVLDSVGRASIWIASDAAVKVVVKDALGVTQYTVDDVTAIGSGSGAGTPATVDEWLIQPEAPGFGSGTTYSIVGDVRPEHHQGRRVRAQLGVGQTYHTITDSVFATGTTTVTVANDSTPLDATLSVVALGILSADNPSASVDCIAGLGSLTTIATGMIIMYGGPTAPAGYALCNGQLLNRTTDVALFSVIGETYGAGDGSTTFAVPDMRGRAPVFFGQGPTTGEGDVPGTPRSIGVAAGYETHTLVKAELPTDPVGDVSANIAQGPGSYVAGAATNPLGSGQAHTIQSPILPVGFIIKL